jgi:hypothetical protein
LRTRGSPRVVGAQRRDARLGVGRQRDLVAAQRAQAVAPNGRRRRDRRALAAAALDATLDPGRRDDPIEDVVRNRGEPLAGDLAQGHAGAPVGPRFGVSDGPASHRPFSSLLDSRRAPTIRRRA